MYNLISYVLLVNKAWTEIGNGYLNCANMKVLNPQIVDVSEMGFDRKLTGKHLEVI